MKRVLFTSLAAVLIAGLMLGCAGQSAPPASQPAPAPAKSTSGEPDPRAAIIEQAKKEGELVIIGSTSDQLMERGKEFQQMYPFIKFQGLSLNTVQSINRIVTESKAGKVSVDLFEISDEGAFALEEQGVLQKPMAPLPHLKDFWGGDRMQPSSGLYVSLFFNPRVQGAFNTDLVPRKELPTSWEQMLDPKWKGKAIIAASVEEMPLMMADMWAKDGKPDWDRSFDWWRKLKAQDVKIVKGYRQGTEQTASGEYSIFWMSVTGSPSRAAIQEKAPIGLFSFAPMIDGFRSHGVVKGAPHPAAAWLWLDYISSPQGQFWYTDEIQAVFKLNQKAKAGQLEQWLATQGVSLDQTVAKDPSWSWNAKAKRVFSEANFEKSERFFLELMGIR